MFCGCWRSLQGRGIPGNDPGRPGQRAKVLRHVIARVEILVRGDSHDCSEPALALLECLRCDYIIGFAINSKLLKVAEPWRAQFDMRRSRTTPDSAPLPSGALQGPRVEPITQARRARRGDDPGHRRSRHRHQPRRPRRDALREGVPPRGCTENLIKDMKRWTRSDKTACSRWN